MCVYACVYALSEVTNIIIIVVYDIVHIISIYYFYEQRIKNISSGSRKTPRAQSKINPASKGASHTSACERLLDSGSDF